MKSTRRFLAGGIAMAAAAAAGAAPPAEGPDSGHYYEVVAAPGIGWPAANAAASAAVLDLGSRGLPGHLATITSAAENAFIHTIRQQAGLTAPEAWVGGFQGPGGEPAGGWTWVNGEGPIPPGQSTFPYANWQPGEPNNLAGNPPENYLGVGLGNSAGWNDEGALGNIGGYVIEYEAVVEATDDGPFEATSGVPLAIDVLANDSVSGTVTVTIEGPPVPGRTIAVGAGPGFIVSYTSATDFEGTDTFSYRVSAGSAYAIAEVTVEVTADQAMVTEGTNKLIFNQAIDPSPDSNNPLTAAYQQVLEGGEVSIDCCRVLDTREGAGKKGSYLAKDFDLGAAIADTVRNPGCAGMPQVPAGKAKLRPWHRGVPKSEGITDIGQPPPPASVRQHDLGVCVIRSNVESKGVVFSAEEARNVLGYSLNGAVPTLRYRPFTGGVSIDPAEIDKPYATPWTAEWDESRSGKRYSTNVMVVNLWHEWLLMPSVPYLIQLATALDDTLKQVKAQGCVENNDGFLNGLRSLVQSARKDILVAALPWLRVSSGQSAVNKLDDATRRALLIGKPAGYDPYNACPGNPQGLFVGRLMALKYAACSELTHTFDSASSLDGACVIANDILCALPELPGFPHPPACQ